MGSTSRRIRSAIGALAVIGFLPLTAHAQQLGNAVNTVKEVATKVAPLAQKAAPVAGKAVQAVRGKGSAPAATSPQPQATANHAAQPQPAPSPVPRRAPAGAPPS